MIVGKMKSGIMISKQHVMLMMECLFKTVTSASQWMVT